MKFITEVQELSLKTGQKDQKSQRCWITARKLCSGQTGQLHILTHGNCNRFKLSGQAQTKKYPNMEELER